MVNVLTLDSGKLVQQSDPQDYMQMVNGRWVETDTASGANAMQLATGKYVGVTGPASCASGTIDSYSQSWTVNSCTSACTSCNNNFGVFRWNVSSSITGTPAKYSMQVWGEVRTASGIGTGDMSLWATVNVTGASVMSGCGSAPALGGYDGAYKYSDNQSHGDGIGNQTHYYRLMLKVICDATSGEIDSYTGSESSYSATECICA